MVFAGIIVPSTFHCSTCLCATSALFLPAVRSWWRNMEKMIRRRNRMSKGRMSITHMLWCYFQVFVCVCKWESVFCFRSGGERGTRGKKERRREKRKGGYCECCEVKFDNLKAVRAEKKSSHSQFLSSCNSKNSVWPVWTSDHQHLESEQHQAFSKSEEYRVLDRVTAGLTCDLMNISTHCRRYKNVITSMCFFRARLSTLA